MPVTPLVEVRAVVAEAMFQVMEESAHTRYQKYWEKLDLDIREPYNEGFDAGVAAMRDCRTCLNHFDTPQHCRASKTCFQGSEWKYQRKDPIWYKKVTNSAIQSENAQRFGHLIVDGLGEAIGEHKP